MTTTPSLHAQIMALHVTHHAFGDRVSRHAAAELALAADAEIERLTAELAALKASQEPRGYLLHWPRPGGGRTLVWNESRVSGDAIGCPVEPLFAAPVPAAEPLTQAATDVLAERRRQIEAEGWTPEHDDKHSGDLEIAAACYATAEVGYEHGRMRWPWAAWWFKPTTKRRNLVKAGALIQAAIEREDRAILAAAKT